VVIDDEMEEGRLEEIAKAAALRVGPAEIAAELGRPAGEQTDHELIRQ
jgi:hypothetical protein